MFNKFLALTAVSVLAIGTTAAHAGDYGKSSADKDMAKIEANAGADKYSSKKLNIVETAMGNDNFDTLVAALKQAELVDALSADGNFTVFAPTDEAFDNVDEDTLASLLKDENRADLQNLLKFHVVPSKIKAKDIAMGTTRVATLQGTEIEIIRTADKITVDGATVVIPDVKTSNGIIHAIDAVAMPE